MSDKLKHLRLSGGFHGSDEKKRVASLLSDEIHEMTYHMIL